MEDHPPQGPHEPSTLPTAGWPRRQVYFVTVEWLEESHGPVPPERLAHAIRHAIEHAHTVAPGTPAARFLVRVKADTAAAEVEGTIEHHHHHHT